MYRLMDGRAEALEFVAVADAPYIGVPLKNLTVRENTLIAVIVRGGQVVIPFGNDHIEPEDTVIIMSKEQGLDDLGDILKHT